MTITDRRTAAAAIVDLLGGSNAIDAEIEMLVEDVLDEHVGGWEEFVPADLADEVERRAARNARLRRIVAAANVERCGESEIVAAINDDSEFGVYVARSGDEDGPIKVIDYGTGEVFAHVAAFPATVGWSLTDEDGDPID